MHLNPPMMKKTSEEIRNGKTEATKNMRKKNGKTEATKNMRKKNDRFIFSLTRKRLPI